MFPVETLEALAERIVSEESPHPLRVAIDGVDGAGKTTLADELVPFIEQRGRPVVRASVDDFHRPRAERHRRGKDSPEGFYFDSFDYDAVRSNVLLPLGPGGDRRVRTAVFDWRSDRVVHEAWHFVAAKAVLLFDGIFLFRPELNECWDLRLLVDAGFDETLKRMIERGADGPDVESRFHERYMPGQQLYFVAVQPKEIADVIVDNREHRTD